MAVFLIIASCIWFGVGVIFVLSLMCAARRGIPLPPEPRLRDGVTTTAQSSATSFTQSQTLTMQESETPQPLADEVTT